MNKIITVKIKPKLIWVGTTDNLVSYTNKGISFSIEKHGEIYQLRKNLNEVGRFFYLKNAKACAELIYGG